MLSTSGMTFYWFPFFLYNWHDIISFITLKIGKIITYPAVMLLAVIALLAAINVVVIFSWSTQLSSCMYFILSYNLCSVVCDYYV